VRIFFLVIAVLISTGPAIAACSDDPIAFKAWQWVARQKNKEIHEAAHVAFVDRLGKRIMVHNVTIKRRGGVRVEYVPVNGRRIRSLFSESHVFIDDSGKYFFQGYLEVFSKNLEYVYRAIAQDGRYKEMVSKINQLQTDFAMTISYVELTRPNVEGSSVILVNFEFPSLEAFCALPDKTIMNAMLVVSDIMMFSMLPIMEAYDLNKP
jgi:hypothetical protein